MRFLLVEDDALLRGVIHASLADAGHRVDDADTLSLARHLWRVQPFDAVLLDLNLPDGNGLAALREARARGDRTPVLVLTARNRTEERVAGLDAGADDYLGKPFELSEVEARLRALVRRAHGADDECAVGQLRLQRQARRFYTRVDGSEQPLDLPAREFEVLLQLMTPPGRVFSKRALSDRLSGFDDALGDNALETFISRLRRKLQGSGAQIRTLRGLGYLIEPDTAAEAPAEAGRDG
jgi:DNA-binding response OmpR family regulator